MEVQRIAARGDEILTRFAEGSASFVGGIVTHPLVNLVQEKSMATALAVQASLPGTPAAEAAKHNFALTYLPENIGPVPAEIGTLTFLFLYAIHTSLKDWNGTNPNKLTAGIRSLWAGAVGCASVIAFPAAVKAFSHPEILSSGQIVAMAIIGIEALPMIKTAAKLLRGPVSKGFSELSEKRARKMAMAQRESRATPNESLEQTRPIATPRDPLKEIIESYDEKIREVKEQYPEGPARDYFIARLARESNERVTAEIRRQKGY